MTKQAQIENDFIGIIAACRNAAGFDSVTCTHNSYWVAALSQPEEVPAFIKDQFKVQSQRIAELERQVAHNQSVIDNLMFEYCPDEMTEEQLDNWEKHQASVNQKDKDDE